MSTSSEPRVVKDWKKRIFLGLVSVSHMIEDRRPDLEEYDSKYKHYVNIRILWRTFSWVFRTPLPYDADPYTG